MREVFAIGATDTNANMSPIMMSSQPGYLELTPEQSKRLIRTEPIEDYYEVEDQPFASLSYFASCLKTHGQSRLIRTQECDCGQPKTNRRTSVGVNSGDTFSRPSPTLLFRQRESELMREIRLACGCCRQRRLWLRPRRGTATAQSKVCVIRRNLTVERESIKVPSYWADRHIAKVASLCSVASARIFCTVGCQITWGGKEWNLPPVGSSSRSLIQPAERWPWWRVQTLFWEGLFYEWHGRGRRDPIEWVNCEWNGRDGRVLSYLSLHIVLQLCKSPKRIGKPEARQSREEAGDVTEDGRTQRENWCTETGAFLEWCSIWFRNCDKIVNYRLTFVDENLVIVNFTNLDYR
ncbi:hypothetical protein J6590_035283 [Homalodisca vitripennis]|nr:hypothetical protein J6590_035283 [Homalodisca vitripennis]